MYEIPSDLSTEVLYFRREAREQVLSVLIWYVTVDGKNRYQDLAIPNNAAKTEEEMLQDALRYTTDFVRGRWFLIEVTTPIRSEYGQLRGGEKVLRARRVAAKTTM